MKKTVALIFTLCLSMCVCGCTGKSIENDDTQATTVTEEAKENYTEKADAVGSDEKKEETQMDDNTRRKLKLTVDGQEMGITLYDTPAANALYEMLPFELDFEDFNGIEKISYLTEKLPTEGEPDGCKPDVGAFCLYAPWGNLSIFYQDFRYSESLIMLGQVDYGMDIISDKNENFSAKLEAVE